MNLSLIRINIWVRLKVIRNTGIDLAKVFRVSKRVVEYPSVAGFCSACEIIKIHCRERVKFKFSLRNVLTGFAGEKIRKIIAKRVPGIKHAYIAQEDGIKDDDIGVENATPEVIIEALNRAKVTVEVKEKTFDVQDMFFFRLNGDPNAKERRIKLGNKLGIGYGNANQMLSRLNNYGITKEEFIEAINYVDKELEGKK